MICEHPVLVEQDGRADHIVLCGNEATLWPVQPPEGVRQVALCPEHIFVAESQGATDG